VVRPHKDLGRAGTVCPFVPGSLERNVLWLAPERIADPGEPDVVELVSGYKRLFRYADDGILFGPYYEGNEGTAIYNSKFRPFQSPVPFLFVRNGVISDWKFFLDNDEWLELWARRYGESAVQALAAELRRTNWRQLG
jgi:hypothetical protein